MTNNSNPQPPTPPIRRAGSATSGPAQRRRRSQRTFAVLTVLALVAGVVYVNSVVGDNDDASAVSGVLDAVDDGFTIDLDTPQTIDIDANDSGDVDISSYVILDEPDNGSLGALNLADATVEYTPAPGWVGTDTFTYQVDETPGAYFDASQLATGRSGGGAIGAGAADPNWRISAGMGGAETAATGVAHGGWVAPPAGSSWICGADCSGARDTVVVFHRDFQIVDQSTADHLALTLDVHSDDRIDQVYVNGVAVGISTGGGQWRAGNFLDLVLDPADGAFSWQVGVNTISLEVRNAAAGPMGLLVKPSTGDEDGDGVTDPNDRCWGTPAGVPVNGDGCRRETATVTLSVTNPAATGCDRLVNGSFEEPNITRNWKGLAADRVPGWEADPAKLEFWNDGFLGADAVHGGQLAELNADNHGTIYQDIATNAGEELTWSVWHRGRKGTDTIEILVGPTDDLGPSLTSMGQFSTGTEFAQHSGTYVVPEGQAETRIVIRHVSSVGGRSLGNLLDAISFGPTGCPVLAPTTTTTAPPTTTTEAPATTTTVAPATTTTTEPPVTTTTVAPTTTTTVPPGVVSGACNLLANGSFEEPLTVNPVRALWFTDVPGWSQDIPIYEFWRDGAAGLTAPDGEQWNEMNSTGPSILYQDVATTPGETLTYAFAHRGRHGPDQVAVAFGPATTLDDLVDVATYETDTEWARYTGTYIVPADQTTTRFALRVVSQFNDPREGNFVDDVTLGVADCDAVPTTTTTVPPTTTTEPPATTTTVPPVTTTTK